MEWIGIIIFFTAAFLLNAPPAIIALFALIAAIIGLFDPSPKQIAVVSLILVSIWHILKIKYPAPKKWEWDKSQSNSQHEKNMREAEEHYFAANEIDATEDKPTDNS